MIAVRTVWLATGFFVGLLGAGACATVETATTGSEVSSTASSSGTSGGAPAACGGVVQCAPDERCGFERCPGCNELPVCRKPGPCGPPRTAARCSDETFIEADCETGLYEAPVTGALTDCEL